MDTTSVAYVLCRIEDDASFTPVSEHEDIVLPWQRASIRSK
jgi:hypothetical protein